MQWQSIETAPKDGTDILGFCRDAWSTPTWPRESEDYVVAHWEVSSYDATGSWVESSGEQYQAYPLTHWMPLPPPPTKE